MPMPTVWPSPAKINLFLHVVGQREDGYHELQTVFQFLDMVDYLKYEVLNDPSIQCNYQIDGLNSDSDLIVRAAKLLQQCKPIKSGVRISLDKRIPIGGGLGGASSNAATTLVALNRLWNVGLSISELMQLGSQLGADVPIFIHANAAWAEGIGERLTTIELSEPWYLVVNPGIHVSTAELFSNPQLTRDHPHLKICAPEPGQFGNDFEELVREQYPEVDAAFKWLESSTRPFLTGTGGCVVSAFDNRAEAEWLQQQCPQAFKSYIAKGYNRSLLAQYLS